MDKRIILTRWSNVHQSVPFHIMPCISLTLELVSYWSNLIKQSGAMLVVEI